MSTRRKTKSAKEVLNSLTAGRDAHEDQAQMQHEVGVLDSQPADLQPAQAVTQQPPDEDGKAPLPPDEPKEAAEDEDAWEDDEEDVGEDEPEPEEAEQTFSDQDKTDLPVLEAQVKHHGLEQARAIREIRQRKLWMLHRNDDGSRRYKSYDEYIDEHWGHTRQWATQQTQQLAVVEKLLELRSRHPDLPDHLSANAVSGLWQLDAAGGYQGSTQEEQEENGLVAVIVEAQEEGVNISRDNLRAICERRAGYYRAKKGSNPPAAPTYAAYKQDCLLAKQLGNGGSYGIVTDAQKLPGNFADNLIAVCTEQRRLPRPDDLLAVVTGQALEEIIPRLNTLAQEVADTEAKVNLLKTRKAEIRGMLQEGGLTKLREETKALQTELEEKGVITKRGGKKKDEADDGPKVEEAEEEAAGEEELNEVQENLDTALESLEAAFDAEWPESEDDGMIQAILLSAQGCEEKLAEIINKAKELLADAEKPQQKPEKPRWTLKPLDPSDPDSF